MKKIITWEVLILIAVVAFILKYKLGGMVGDVFSLIGVASLIIAYIKFRKIKKSKDLTK